MPAGDPASVRAAAHDILSRPEFRPPHLSPPERALRWLSKEFTRLLADALGGRFSLVGIVMLAAVVVLVGWLGVRLVRGLRADRRVGQDAAPARGAPVDWLAEAEACERRGDYRGALRARHRALVAELARRGVVAEIPGRTAGEYRREVTRSRPQATGDFGSATELFEAAIYGGTPAVAADSTRLSDLSKRVLEETR